LAARRIFPVAFIVVAAHIKQRHVEYRRDELQIGRRHVATAYNKINVVITASQMRRVFHLLNDCIANTKDLHSKSRPIRGARPSPAGIMLRLPPPLPATASAGPYRRAAASRFPP